jgi:hypothetical protein
MWLQKERREVQKREDISCNGFTEDQQLKLKNFCNVRTQHWSIHFVGERVARPGEVKYKCNTLEEFVQEFVVLSFDKNMPHPYHFFKGGV